MCAILQPAEVPQRRAMTPQHRNNEMQSSAAAIGIGFKIQTKYEAQDPATTLKPSNTFRKATEASLDRLWQKENEFTFHEDKNQSKSMMEKVQSRERYY